MMVLMIKDIIIKPDSTIRQAMKVLDKTDKKCLLVVDDNEKLLGTLTDGDLRRSILAGEKISGDISSSYNSEPTVLIKEKYTIEEAEHYLRNLKLGLIPVVDENYLVIDYINWSKIGVERHQDKSLKDAPVIIMAGGKGTRLEPFTKVLPKPLLPINDKPIIEHIIESFTLLGCDKFYLTIHYKGKILKAYFEELSPSYDLHFVEEEKPMGTAGCLRKLIGKFKKPFFVTNCDTIIKTDYTKLYKFHQKMDYDLTLVASAKEYIIPYGTCEINSDGDLSQINEKPKYDFLINTGMYVLNPEVLKIIPKNSFYHITHLVEEMKRQGKKVGVFPVDDDAWIDVGQWAEYETALGKL